MRKALVLAALTAAAGAASASAGAPAWAQPVSFALTGGSLSIAEPGTATLTGGSVLTLAGTTITGPLGSTTVSDLRGGVLGWTVSIAQTTAFSNGATSLLTTSTKVWVPAAIVPTSGVATVNAGLYTSQLTPLSLVSTPQPYVWATAVVGDNVTSFTPYVGVALPSNVTSGAYSGALSQTVA